MEKMEVELRINAFWLILELRYKAIIQTGKVLFSDADCN